MEKLKTTLKGTKGFTLVELVVVIAILGRYHDSLGQQLPGQLKGTGLQR